MAAFKLLTFWLGKETVNNYTGSGIDAENKAEKETERVKIGMLLYDGVRKGLTDGTFEQRPEGSEGARAISNSW